MSKPSLQFGPGDVSGFTSLTTATFNDVPPARILRELIQNSLDAAVEAREKTAKVRFEVSFIGKDDVPDLAGYRRAFHEAVSYHTKRNNGKLDDPAQQVVDTIEGALSKNVDYLLSVYDNGVGFDQRRMTAVLGDGSGAKEIEATGSYGVGHFSALATSSLRYLLYGGISSDSVRTASGLTIIASRPGKQYPTSARGYFVKRLFGGEGGKLFEFSTGREIPRVIRAVLDKIQKDWKHGSVVMIPSFNYFGFKDDRRLTDIIPLVAAFNFSAAIHAGSLVIEVDESRVQGGEYRKVSAANLRDILESERARERGFRSDTWRGGLRPSGKDAWGAYQALSQGKGARVPTMAGNADVCVLVPAPAGQTRLDLFRNGMWITGKLPYLNPSSFADWEAFQAVLMPRPGTDLHRLVRKAEGPMHDELSLKLLSKVEREKLRTALRAVATWLKSEVPKMDAETYTPDDFLVVSSGGDGGAGAPTTYSMWGSPVVVQRARSSQQRTDGTDKDTNLEPDSDELGKRGHRQKKGRKASTKRSRPLPFRSTGVPRGQGQYHIELECSESVEEVLLRFRIDENTDATSDRLWPDEDVVIDSFTCKDSEGAALSAQMEDGNTSIRLFGLTAGKYEIAIEYNAPPDLRAVRAPVFRVDLHRPAGE